MKIRPLFNISILLVLTSSILIGCAGTTEEEPKQAQAPNKAASAIASAEAAYKIALDELYAWRDTGKIIKQAKTALKKGDDSKAIKLANKAKKQAEDAVAQKYSELERIRNIIADKPEMKSSSSDGYEVETGDNLWNISAKSDIYSNPYQWPLIYKANKDQIKDADLIYPGQNLVIDRSASSEDIDAAVNHAKSRGSWSIGNIEDSDTRYLSK